MGDDTRGSNSADLIRSLFRKPDIAVQPIGDAPGTSVLWQKIFGHNSSRRDLGDLVGVEFREPQTAVRSKRDALSLGYQRWNVVFLNEGVCAGKTVKLAVILADGSLPGLGGEIVIVAV